jgi:preprotein translocase subunit YajC
MRNRFLIWSFIATAAFFRGAVITLCTAGSSAAAQNPSQNPAGPISELQQKLAEVKQAAAENKRALAHYSWQQQETIAVKGNVKDTKMFQVHLGPDGKPQKVEMENLPQSSGPERGLRGHIKEKKGEEYKEYGQQIGALAQQYTQPDPERLQQAYQQGNLMLASGGMPGEVKMIIKNYVKPNDQVTLVFDRQGKAIKSLQIQSYLTDPKDAVTIAAQYSRLQDGTNHVSTMQINGVSKDLLITTQNSNYQRMM